MIHALIFAGGTGQRMNTRARPKQFLELHGKPIIIYTLDHFENHHEIDNIIVVCVENWIQDFKKMLHKYALKKVSLVVPGGNGGDKSIYNGLKALNNKAAFDDIVLIHDGVRPLINAALISENITKVKEYGNAITVEQTTESTVRLNDDGCISDIPPRAQMFMAKAPQSFRHGEIWNLYQKANNEGIRAIDPAHMCSIYGMKMHTVRSTPNNMKITAPHDYYIFRALFEAIENEQIIGI